MKRIRRRSDFAGSKCLAKTVSPIIHWTGLLVCKKASVIKNYAGYIGGKRKHIKLIDNAVHKKEVLNVSHRGPFS